MSPYLLPVVTDRPLVMKRFPNGIAGKAFYQQRSREERPPAGVRIETLPDELDPIGEPGAKRLIGGSLTTLLYMTQIAAISQDPWFSRVQSPLDADHAAIDLDPTDGTPFARCSTSRGGCATSCTPSASPDFRKRRARAACTSTCRCRRDTSYESGMLFCQIVATVVATRHPKVATVERMVAAPAARDGLRRFPAEHPRQDAGDGVQRARQRVRGRVDAADVEGSGQHLRSRGLHDPHGAGAIQTNKVISGKGCGRRSLSISKRCCGAMQPSTNNAPPPLAPHGLEGGDGAPG